MSLRKKLLAHRPFLIFFCVVLVSILAALTFFILSDKVGNKVPDPVKGENVDVLNNQSENANDNVDQETVGFSTSEKANAKEVDAVKPAMLPSRD